MYPWGITDPSNAFPPMNNFRFALYVLSLICVIKFLSDFFAVFQIESSKNDPIFVSEMTMSPPNITIIKG